MKATFCIPRLAWFSRNHKRTKERTHSPRIGLCLSSGGARGLAHVGVIQVLEEAGIPIAALAGSSMGAYVGALWAAGFDGRKLESLAREIKDRWTLFRLLDPVFPPSRGLIRGDRIRQHLERSMAGRTFEQLSKPMIVVATDLDTMTPHVFNRGPVSPAVIASAAIPGVCQPVMVDGRRFTDGGASDPLPVCLLRQRYPLDAVIAVNVLPTRADLESRPEAVKKKSWNPLRWLNLLASGNVLDVFSRALRAAQVQMVTLESTGADVVIHPIITEGSWHDFHNFDRYIKAGRDAATAALPQIRDLLTRVSPIKHEGDYHETPQPCPPLGFLAA